MSLPAEVQNKLKAFMNGKKTAELKQLAHNLANAHLEQVNKQAQWQTEDYFNMKNLNEGKMTFRDDCQKLIAKIDGKGDSSKVHSEIADLKAQLKKVDEEVNKFKDVARNAQASIEAVRQEATAIAKNEVNEKLVNQVNSLLEEESPALFVAFIENMVAMLRNRTAANNVDVELYFADWRKLQRKMMKHEATGYTVEYINAKENKFNEMRAEYLAQFPKLATFMNWALKWCAYAKKALATQVDNNQAQQKEKEQRVLEDKLETLNHILHVQMGPELKKILEKNAAEAESRKAKLVDQLKHDKEQSLLYQKRLANFEADLTAGLK